MPLKGIFWDILRNFHNLLPRVAQFFSLAPSVLADSGLFLVGAARNKTRVQECVVFEGFSGLTACARISMNFHNALPKYLKFLARACGALIFRFVSSGEVRKKHAFVNASFWRRFQDCLICGYLSTNFHVLPKIVQLFSSASSALAFRFFVHGRYAKEQAFPIPSF